MEKPIKILFVGDSSVGKTSLMKRFANQKFDDATAPTIGVDFMPASIEIAEKAYTLSFWDTAGAEANGMTALQPLFYRNAEGVLLVYDVTKRSSFENIQNWNETVGYYTNNPNIVKMLVGNKIDLADRVVRREEAREFAMRSSMLFVETSALTSENVNYCFNELVSSICVYIILGDICYRVCLDSENIGAQVCIYRCMSYPNKDDLSVLVRSEKAAVPKRVSPVPPWFTKMGGFWPNRNHW